MEKKVEFYKITYNFFPIVSHNLTDEQLKQQITDVIIEAVDTDDTYTIKSTSDTSVIIEMLEANSDFLFGNLGKLENLKDGPLKRLRDMNKEVINGETYIPKFYVENYTYFYIRLKDFMCAVLSNPSAPRFRRHFRNYLSDITKDVFLEKLNIVNVVDDNIDYKLNRVKNVSKILMAFDGSSNIGNDLLNLADTFYLSQSSLLAAKIDINLKMEALTDKTRALLRDPEVIQSDFKKLELSGVDANEEEVEVELVERILTKTVSIDIDEKYLKSSEDLDKIKIALRQALPPI